jgi:ABC-type transport system involved in multi-copper enzyme maturation permease subunit
MTALRLSPLWRSRARQALAVARLDLGRLVRSRRILAPLFLNLAPVAILVLSHLIPLPRDEGLGASGPELATIYSRFFTLWMLRIAVFFTAAALAIQLWRGEVLDKTMHYYLLAPLRRSMLVAGKCIAVVVASTVICAVAAAGAYLALFAWLGPGLGRFLFEGPGLGQLLTYLGVILLGCLGYGAAFTLFGVLFRNPMIPVLALLGWESALFLLPPALKLASVLHYLQGLLPVRPPGGAVALMAAAPSALGSVAGMLAFAAVALALAGWRASRMEILYSTDS